MPVGPRLPRRSALALTAAGLVSLSACDGAGSTPAGVPAASADPDSALVDRVLAELRRAHRLATAAGLTGLAELHAAHIDALDGTPPRDGRRRRVDAAVVRRHERQLQARLVHAAMAAESGALARLLASMSAAVSQRLVGR